MPHALPPRPRGATARLALLVLALVVPAGGGFGLLAAAPWPLALFGWVGVLVVLAAAGFMGVALGVDRRDRTLVRTRRGGTEFPVSRVVLGLAWTILGGLLLLAVGFALAGLVGVLSGGFSLRAVLGLAFWTVMLGLAVPPVLRLLRGELRRGGLLLTDHGVTWSNYHSEHAIAWGDLADVRLVADPGRRLVLRARSPERVRRSGGPRSWAEQPSGGPRTGPDEVSVSLTFLASDGAVVADAVQHYRDRRGHRAELGTDAALDRWRRPRPR